MSQTGQIDEASLPPEIAGDAAATQGPIVVEETKALFCFWVGDTQLAVPVTHVVSVREPQPAVQIPRTPAHIVGFVVVGERAVVAVDAAALLGVPRDPGADGRLVEMRASDMQLALLVDRAVGVARVPASKLRDPTAFTGSVRAFLSAETDANGKLCGLLDAARLVTAAQVRSR